MTALALVAPLAPLAKSGEAAKSGPIGLAIILVLCIACYFLFKSMSKHLRTVREQFPGQISGADRPAARVAPPLDGRPGAAAAVDLVKHEEPPPAEPG